MFVFDSSCCLRILEEQTLNPYEVESENERNECRKLQVMIQNDIDGKDLIETSEMHVFTFHK